MVYNSFFVVQNWFCHALANIICCSFAFSLCYVLFFDQSLKLPFMNSNLIDWLVFTLKPKEVSVKMENSIMRMTFEGVSIFDFENSIMGLPINF